VSVHLRSFRPAPIIASVLLAVLLPWYLYDVAKSFPIDFSSFWCAGRAVLRGQNPYLDSSLHGCQVAHGLVPSLTIPVPYPPYALLFFAALALVPFAICTVLWQVALIGNAWLTAYALRRLTGASWLLTFSLSALTLVAVLQNGQVATIPVCAFAWSLVFIREKRQLAATLALAVVAILPNFALAAWLATWLVVPRQRISLLVMGTVLAGVSFMAVHPAGVASYLAISSSFARSIGGWFAQVGWLPLLAATGVPPGLVPGIAYAILVASLAAGFFLGLRLGASAGEDYWVIATVTAAGVVGAPYLHGWDLGFCVPLALLLFMRWPENVLVRATLLLIATPWVQLVEHGGAQNAIAIPFILLVADAVTAAQLVPAALSALCIVLFSLALLTFAYDSGKDAAVADARFRSPALAPGALADARFDAFIARPGPRRTGWYERFPTYVELVFLTIATWKQSSRKIAQ
jgi:hypothetical protein